MFCNALIQPQLDYTCSAWYPNFNEKSDKNIQKMQKKKKKNLDS